MSDALPVIDAAAVATPATSAASLPPAANGPGPPAAAGTAVSGAAFGFAPILQQLRAGQQLIEGVVLAPDLDLAAEPPTADATTANGSVLPPADAATAPPLPLAALSLPLSSTLTSASAELEGAVESPPAPQSGALATVLSAQGSASRSRDLIAAVADQLASAPGRAQEPAPATLTSTLIAGGASALHHWLDGAGALEALAPLGEELATASPGSAASALGAEAGRALAPLLAIDGVAGSSTAVSRPAATPSLSVSAPLHDDGFVNELNNRLVWMSRNDVQLAEIRINPPQLGPVEVRVAVSNGETSVFFTSPHAAVREVLEAAIPRLRESFLDQGLVLADAGVSDHSRDARRGGDSRGYVMDDRSALADPAMEASPTSLAAGPPKAGANLMLDVYA